MTADIEPLVLEDVSKIFTSGDDTVLALDGVSANVGSAEFVAVTGPSGSGKSTLLHCASGLDTVDSGAVFLNGVDIVGMRDRELTLLRRRATGFIFQAYNLMKTKTARENILYPLRLQKRRIDKDWLSYVASSLGIQNLLDRYPNQLSGGQQQRVAIARSMMSQPQIIFADEPTGALDSEASDQLLSLFSWCTTELGLSVLMVTHDLAAANRADRIIDMLDGRIRRVLEPDSGESRLVDGGIS